MGLIPARAWDTEGVTSLRALQAPFLIDSEELMARVVTSELAGEMLAGLDRAGVVGLALLPEELRHPFGFGRTLRSLGDFAGQTVRAPRSELTFSALRLLGATPEDLVGAAFSARVADGSVAGADSGFALASGLPRAAIATANVTLYPKVSALVVDRDAWVKLTDEQRATLRDAARRTLARILERSVPEAELARRYCARGGRVVLAEQADLAAMTAAVQPLYADLERDAGTKALIAGIRELEGGLPATAGSPPSECRPPAPAAVAQGDEGARVLDGVWRVEIEYEEGIEAGLPPDVAAQELGVQTIRLASGRYDWRWRARDGEQRCPGTYEVAGDLVVFTDEGECSGSWEAAFERAGRTIRWSRVLSHAQGDPVDQALRELLYGKPWTRIAEVRSAGAAFPEGVYRADIAKAFLVDRGLDAATAESNRP